MAHVHPAYPFFTHEVCRRGLLQEPFRLVDVGVRGGVAPYWFSFGDHLELWGIAPLFEEGVGPLIAANPDPRRFHYLNVGLGEVDGERLFRFYPENPSSSHFAASNGSDEPYIDDKWRKIPLRRLDTLFAEGQIAPVDFMKMDAETYEIEILKGAREFFRSSGIFGVESESTFFRTRRNPQSHFVELYAELAAHGFHVFDAGFQRVPREPLSRGFPRRDASGNISLRPTGQAFVFDFLFLRDEFEDGKSQKYLSVDRLIKMISVAEIYGLQDVGLDIFLSNKEALGTRLDVARASDWLVRDDANATMTYAEYRAI